MLEGAVASGRGGVWEGPLQDTRRVTSIVSGERLCVVRANLGTGGTGECKRAMCKALLVRSR